MKETDVIQLVQHYRHDLLNQLQLVQGYLSMDKKDKAEEKLTVLFSALNEERKLTSLQAPKFALWLLQFNHIYKNFRITYKIGMENHSYASHDEFLVMKCKDIMDKCEELGDPYVLYDVELYLDMNELTIFIQDLKNAEHSLAIQAENKTENIEVTDHGIVFRIEI